MKKFLTVAVAVLLIIFFTFPTSGFGDIQGTTTDGGGSESTTTTQAPPDSTTTTTSPDSTTTTTSSNTTTTTSPPDSTTTTTVPDNSTTTTIVLGDTTPSQTTTAPDSSTTTTETTLPLDITPPVIILNGNALIELKTGDIFTDPGATATDDKDASVAVTASGIVDTSKAGSYILTYNASDIEGNAALAVTRTVKVAELPDIIPPVIILNGDAVINLKIGDVFTDPGATATDNKDESVTVTASGEVNTNFASSYTINYNASDAAGNAAATVTRTINVTSIATVFTDKPDYLPDDYVLVTGGGWLPGETVKLDFHETLLDPVYQQTITYYTVADGEGNIRDLQYLIDIRHLGASFMLTATGQMSGLTAQTTFTDGSSGTATITITKKVYKSNGVTEDLSDTTTFTIELWKSTFAGALTGSLPIATVNLKSNESSIPIIVTTGMGIYYKVKEIPNSNYNLSYTPSSDLFYPAYSGQLNLNNSTANSVTVKNTQKASTTVTIKKEVYESDGTTLDTTDTTKFNIELWRTVLGFPFEKITTVNDIQSGQTSAQINVSPGSSYCVIENPANSNYSTTYYLNTDINPSGALGVSGIITATNGSSDMFTVKNTKIPQGPATIKVYKDVFDTNGTTNISDPHPFDVTLMKGGILGIGGTIVGTDTIWEEHYATFTDTPDAGGTYYWIEEGTDTDYVSFDGVGFLKGQLINRGETKSFTVKNKKLAPAIITIRKDVFDVNGQPVTPVPGDTRTFKIELYETTALGAPTGAPVETVYIVNGGISEPISVAPNRGYCVKEVLETKYDTTYSPAGLGLGYSGMRITSPGSNYEFTVNNTSTGNTFTITKTGLKNNDKARFTLKDPNGAVVETSIGANSIVLDCSDSSLIYSDIYTWNRLPDGIGYRLVEIDDLSLGNTYTYSSNLTNYEHTFNITGAPESLTVNNEALGTITAFKTDKAGSLLEGATLGLYTEELNENSIIRTATSDETTSGNVIFQDVPSGGEAGKTYYIHEISSPDGYTFDPAKWYKVEINDKSDAELNPVLSENIINKGIGSIIIKKIDNKGKLLPGADFGLYNTKEDPSPIIATSDANGEVKFEELSVGEANGKTYYIREISAPDGFAPDPLWYEVTLTKTHPADTSLTITNFPGGTITVKKDVRAPDGIHDAQDAKDFDITLEQKNSSGDWVPYLTATINENNPKTFTVPNGYWYKVTEEDAEGYIKLLDTGPRYVSKITPCSEIQIINKQKYATITVTKLVINNLLDTNLFLVRLEGSYTPLLEWHPLSTIIPAVFLVWPGTYNAVEMEDSNYFYGTKYLAGFPVATFPVTLPNEVSVGPGGSASIIMTNWYEPEFGTVTVTKKIVAPDGCTTIPEDTKGFEVKLQRLGLNASDVLKLKGLPDITDLSNLTDLSFLLNLTGLEIWQDVEVPEEFTPISQNNDAVFTGIEKDHIYRVVEKQVSGSGYMQISGMLPFYFEPDHEGEEVSIVNRQELVFIKVFKDVVDFNGNDVSDCHPFFVRLVGGSPTLDHPFAEGSPTVFAVWPGFEYSVLECLDPDYSNESSNVKITPKPGEGSICNPIVLTITNKQKPGSITITKTVIGGSDKATFNIDGPGNNDFSSIVLASGESWSNTELPWGTYKITETSMNGYQTPSFIVNGKAPVAASSVDVIIGNGDCASLAYRVNVTNTVTPGSLTISKTVVGGSDNATFNVDGPGSNDFGGTIGQGGSLSFTNLPWGTYTITETPMNGYQTPSFVVNGGAPVAASSVIVIVGNKTDEALTYTVNVTNTVIPGSLTIKKTVVGGSDNATFNVDGPGSNDFGGSIGQGKSLSFTNLPWGTYTITETPMSGYQTPSFVVNGGAPVAASSVVVIVGNKTDEALTYTVDVTNTVIPGSLTISKTVIGGSDSALFFVDGPEENDFSFNLAPNVSWSRTDLPWGTYTITEAAMSGYQTPSFVVNGEAPVAASSVVVIIGNGQDAALTHRVDVTNTVIPGSITINKTGMLAGDSIVFTVTGPAGFIPATVTLTAAPGETTASAVLSNLAWGDYTITETINPNYSATPTFDVIAGFNLVQNAGNSVTITIPGTGADNSKILDAILTVTNTYTPPTTPPATAAPSTAQVEVLGLATGEELSQEPARISVLGIKELPLTGENILLIFGGILLIGALSLILALSLRKRPAK